MRDEVGPGRERGRRTSATARSRRRQSPRSRETPSLQRGARESARAFDQRGQREREKEGEDAHKHHCPPCRRAIFFILVIVPDKKLPVSPNVSFCAVEGSSAVDSGERREVGAQGSPCR